MRVLIIDSSAEQQAETVKIFESIPASDAEILDLRFKLANENDFEERLDDDDLVILGPGLGERALNIARRIHHTHPWVQIIMLCHEQAYQQGLFRSAPFVGVRKVFSITCNPLDFLQELLAIHAEFKKKGRAREGKIFTVTQAKGGVGVTTVVAALGEVAAFSSKRVLLWDMDIESRDLSTALGVIGNQDESRAFSLLINGTKEISRDSFNETLVAISENVFTLSPPDTLAESVDLVCHTDGIALMQRFLEICRIMFDYVFIDTCGRIGPSTGTAIRLSDTCIIVIDETRFGLSAVDLYLNYILNLLGDSERIKFILNALSGSPEVLNVIAEELNLAHNFSENCWVCPPIPVDKKGSTWPGSGQTLYSRSSKKTREILEAVGHHLGVYQLQTEPEETKKGIFSRLFGR